VGTRLGCVCLGSVTLSRFVGCDSRCGDLDPRMTFSHFLGGTRHGRCSRVMTRGIEIRVLDCVNPRSLAGSGCESFLKGLSMGSIPEI
jgi:hypothetical protein